MIRKGMMVEYRGLVKERTKATRIGFAVLAGLMLVLEALRRQWFYVPFAIIVILACFLEKEQLIDSEGIETRLKLFGRNLREEFWPWEEISLISVDGKKRAPNSLLHFRRDTLMRSYEVHTEDVRDIIALAKKRNSKLRVDELA